MSFQNRDGNGFEKAKKSARLSGDGFQILASDRNLEQQSMWCTALMCKPGRPSGWPRRDVVVMDGLIGTSRRNLREWNRIYVYTPFQYGI
jgi:hypothetical protein